MFADLHLHSTFSDGTLGPVELAWACHERGVEAISITDHDAWGQNAALAAASLPDDLVWIPGIEVSTQHAGTGLRPHVLGYALIPDEPFEQMLHGLQSARAVRVRGMGEALGSLGIVIDVAGILDRAGSPGKPDVARDALARQENRARLDADGVRDVGGFIHAYLERGRPAHVPKSKVATADVVAAIRRCGGHPVWAHPAVDLRDLRAGDPNAVLERVVVELVEAGLEGLEAGNLAHTPAQQRQLRDAAARHGLRWTAGSDFHDLEDKDTCRILTDCYQDIKWLVDGW